MTHYPDFLAASKEYDEIEVNISRDINLFRLFYLWDVDSIVVWNPEIVIPM